MTTALDVIDLIDDMEQILREMDVPISEFETIGDTQYRCTITPTRLEDAKKFLLEIQE